MRNTLDKLIEIITTLALGLMVVICLWQITSRYLLGSPSSWSEELMRYGLIWLSFLGAPYAYGKGKHLAVVFALQKLKKPLQSSVQIGTDLTVALFALIILIVGGFYVVSNALGQNSAALGMPIIFLYAAGPVSGLLFLFYAFINIKERLNPKEVL